MTLDDLAKLCDEATPGPWEIKRDSIPEFEFKRCYLYSPKNECLSTQYSNDHYNNAMLIAAARTYMPELISRVRKLEAERDKLITVARAAQYFLEDPSQTYGWKEQLRRALAELEQE